MSQSFALVTFIFLNIVSFSMSIFYSEDVGKVTGTGKNMVITGQTLYPYVVHIRTFYTNENGRRRSQFCTGIIIGLDAVLTAGHCLQGKTELKADIYAGIVDVKLEAEGAQKLKMKDYLVHKEFRDDCVIGDIHCFNLDDVAIIWTRKKFTFGPTVKIATLYKDAKKPAGQTGYIVGWGKNEKGEFPSMLQRGAMKVLTKQQCKLFVPNLYYPITQMCLASVTKKTRACGGDSGGPFVINDVVYGVSSNTIFDDCQKNTMDLYTYVAGYVKWIDANLKLGPPQKRKRRPSPSNRATHK